MYLREIWGALSNITFLSCWPPTGQRFSSVVSLFSSVQLLFGCPAMGSDVSGGVDFSLEEANGVLRLRCHELEPKLIMKTGEEDFESRSGEETDDAEVNLNDTDDEDLYDVCGSLPKSQFRFVASKARWNSEMGMAEVVEKKGKMWVTSGIVRGGGKTCCWLEETAFLAEIGALLLINNDGTSLSLEDIYMKVALKNCGCDWEMFEVYKHLKSLGYVIGRHSVPWSLKGVGTDLQSDSSEGASENNRIMGNDAEDMTSIAEMLSNCNIDGVRPVFDVYLPNSKFRKSSPGVPNCIVCLSRGCPPSKGKIEALERRCSGIPLKFCHVEDGHVSFFSFDRMELPVLP